MHKKQVSACRNKKDCEHRDYFLMRPAGDVMTIYREQVQQQSCVWLNTTTQQQTTDDNWLDLNTEKVQIECTYQTSFLSNTFFQDAGQLMSLSVIFRLSGFLDLTLNPNNPRWGLKKKKRRKRNQWDNLACLHARCIFNVSSCLAVSWQGK